MQWGCFSRILVNVLSKKKLFSNHNFQQTILREHLRKTKSFSGLSANSRIFDPNKDLGQKRAISTDKRIL